MLSIFPQLFTYSAEGIALLRITLGVIFLLMGLRTISKDREMVAHSYASFRLKPGAFFAILLGVIEFIFGVLMSIGLYTQIAAIAIGLISLKLGILKELKKNFTSEPTILLFVLFVISVTILLTGAGNFAFDLPL